MHNCCASHKRNCHRGCNRKQKPHISFLLLLSHLPLITHATHTMSPRQPQTKLRLQSLPECKTTYPIPPFSSFFTLIILQLWDPETILATNWLLSSPSPPFTYYMYPFLGNRHRVLFFYSCWCIPFKANNICIASNTPIVASFRC